MELGKLTIPELLALQAKVNGVVEQLKERASKSLSEGGKDKYFTFKEGKAKRVVTNQKYLTTELRKHFDEDALVVSKPITMTASEKLLKTVLEPEEVTEIMDECTEKQKGKPTLVYIGDSNG